MSIVNRRRAAVADVDSDVEIFESNGEVVEENLRDAGENEQQIRALISRMADLEHYNAINDIDFLIEAIGQKDYAGSPALDVLPSHDGIGQERRERIREYIHILNCWTGGKDVEDAAAEFKSDEKLLRKTYIHLGETDEGKRNLILALSDNLEEKSASPEDAISQISDEEFIRYVYKTILDREPDEDDARLRLTQLKRDRTRQELINDILESRENSRRMMAVIAESITESNDS